MPPNDQGYTIGPDGVPLITIGTNRNPNQSAAQGDWATKYAPPQDAAPAPTADQPVEDFATKYTAPPPDEAMTPDQPPKAFSAGDAALKGGIDAFTMGLAPAMVGATDAGKGTVDEGTLATMPPAAFGSGIPDIAGPAADFVGGLIKLFKGDPQAKQTYDATRASSLADQNNAYAQHPLPFIGGQIGGALLSAPVGGGESLLARLAKMVGTGAAGGAAYSGGASVSQGNSPTQVLKDAAQGGAGGAAMGGIGGAALEGAGTVGSKLMALFRGGTNASDEAASRVVTAANVDLRNAGPALDPEARQAAQAAGLPLANADEGGERTLALARSAANTSPEARAALSEFAGNRFEGQSGRVAGAIRRMTGNPDNYLDNEAIRGAARKANAPAYQRAYAAGDRQIWNPEIERLSSSPDVMDAARAAQRDWKAWQVADGFGSMNPGMKIAPGGVLKFTNAKGVPTYPNIQYFDYVARHLADAAQQARDAGKRQVALRIGTAERALKATLDKEVPEYQAARQGAAGFFGSEDALEAGDKFVSGSFDKSEARASLAKMSRPDRELFARGFAAKLSTEIERTGYNRDVLNSVFLNNDDAKQRIKMALGSDRARQLEALLRAESVVDRLRKSLGNSTTARQLKEMGMAGGPAATTLAMAETMGGPTTLAIRIAGALIHKASEKVDEGVAKRVGELLVSQNPRDLVRGIEIITRTPVLFNALRRLTTSGAVVTERNVGTRKAAAGAYTAYDAIREGEDHEETDKGVMSGQMAQ
jgi:hypothetical protein